MCCIFDSSQPTTLCASEWNAFCQAFRGVTTCTDDFCFINSTSIGKCIGSHICNQPPARCPAHSHAETTDSYRGSSSWISEPSNVDGWVCVLDNGLQLGLGIYPAVFCVLLVTVKIAAYIWRQYCSKPASDNKSLVPFRLVINLLKSETGISGVVCFGVRDWLVFEALTQLGTLIVTICTYQITKQSTALIVVCVFQGIMTPLMAWAAWDLRSSTSYDNFFTVRVLGFWIGAATIATYYLQVSQTVQTFTLFWHVAAFAKAADSCIEALLLVCFYAFLLIPHGLLHFIMMPCTLLVLVCGCC